MSFTVGETVVYPNHGAAVIEDIEMRQIKGESENKGIVVQPTPRVPDGRLWHVTSLYKASFMLYAGYEQRGTKFSRTGQLEFWFSRDGDLGDLLEKYKKRELLVEPEAFIDAFLAMKKIMNNAKNESRGESIRGETT